jgi:hypothetical protein
VTNRKFQTAHGYLAFERVIGIIESRLIDVVPEVLGYRAAVVKKRIVQRVIDLGLFSFVREYARYHDRGQDILSTMQKRVRFAGMSVDLQSGSVRIGFRLFLRSFAEFFVHWLHVAAQATAANLQNKTRKGASTLLFGVGGESLKVEGNDARFVEYCERGPIAPLSHASCLIVQTLLEIQSTRPNRFKYARFPLFALMRANAFGGVQFLRFGFRHLHVLGTYLFAIIRCPLISILGRDFAYHAMLEHLDRENLIESVVITNTNYSAQPLWMTDLPGKRFQTHMVWYSQNAIPLVYADDPVESDLPNYRYMRVDVSWVWTAPYAAYLRSLGVRGEINVIGPILWQLPPADAIPRNSRNDLTLVVFDVTPVSDERAEQIGLFRNYYNAANMIEFLRGVVRAKDELEQNTGKSVRVLLKHKRGFNFGHDRDYIKFVEKLLGTATVELIPFNVNIYELILQADLVVVVPYSSPAYIADHLGIPSVFFDSSGELLPTYKKGCYIVFASGCDELIHVVDLICSA